MKNIKVFVTRKWPKSVEDKLIETFDTKLNLDDSPMNESELIDAMQNYDALLPTVTDKINDKIISCSNRKVKIIGNFGVGFNNIDINSAKKNQIVVTNTPEVLTDCTADIAMLLMLGIARRAPEGEPHVRNENWDGWRPTHMMGTKVTGKTLGLVGMGRIAQAMAQKSHFGFNMNILYFDPYFNNKEIAKKFNAKSCESLEELLAASDFVSLHCPSNEETRGIIQQLLPSHLKSGMERTILSLEEWSTSLLQSIDSKIKFGDSDKVTFQRFRKWWSKRQSLSRYDPAQAWEEYRGVVRGSDSCITVERGTLSIEEYVSLPILPIIAGSIAVF